MWQYLYQRGLSSLYPVVTSIYIYIYIKQVLLYKICVYNIYTMMRFMNSIIYTTIELIVMNPLHSASYKCSTCIQKNINWMQIILSLGSFVDHWHHFTWLAAILSNENILLTYIHNRAHIYTCVHILTYIELKLFKGDVLIIATTTSTQPHLDVIHCAVIELLGEPRRVVEAAVIVRATPLTIPQRIIWVESKLMIALSSVTEVVISNNYT